MAQTSDKKKDLEFIQAIQDPRVRKKQLLILVQRWLKEKKNWLLIYDNVEDISDIKEYLPENANVWGNGKVIITTRDSNIKNTNYIKPEGVIQIEELSKEEALTLFTKIFYDQDSLKHSLEHRRSILKFLENIPPFPLDISAVAYYLKTSKITFDEYLEKVKVFSKSFDQVQESLLKEKTNYTKTRYGVLTLSLKKLVGINPKFKGLLLLSCILDSQNIPKILLNDYDDKATVDAFFNQLRKYSFITQETTVGFSMHRSTQAIGLTFLLDLLTGQEQKTFMEKIISITSLLYDPYMEQSCESKILLIPHLESLSKNMERLDIEKALKKKYQQKILLMLGHSYFDCTGNLLMAKKYWSQIFKMRVKNSYISDLESATILKNLGGIELDLSLSKESIAYCEKGLSLAEKIPNSEILIAETLRIMGFSHNQKGDFKKSNDCFQKALKKISNLDSTIAIKEKAAVLSTMALIHAREYINKYEKKKIEGYLNEADKIFNTLKKEKKLSNPEILRYQNRTGRTYNLLGMYKKALEENFKESLNLINNEKLSGDMHFSKIYVFMGVGETLLREGKIKEAEKFLTESILAAETLAGIKFFLSVMSRLEARIRLERFDEAYEDFQYLFNKRNQHKTNEANLSNMTIAYHGAIIRYKQSDLKRSTEYFAEFFSQAEKFCQKFLKEKEYKDLKSKNIFALVDLGKNPCKNDIKKYLDRSTHIFSAIYGADHPFVKDYVMKN